MYKASLEYFEGWDNPGSLYYCWMSKEDKKMHPSRDGVYYYEDRSTPRGNIKIVNLRENQKKEFFGKYFFKDHENLYIGKRRKLW